MYMGATDVKVRIKEATSKKKVGSPWVRGSPFINSNLNYYW